MSCQCSDCLPLCVGQRRAQRELLSRSLRRLVRHVKAAACLPDQGRDFLRQSAWQDQPAIESLVEALQETRDAPGGDPQPLPIVEQRIRHRRRVLERGLERRCQF
jgi:hypothetical protein